MTTISIYHPSVRAHAERHGITDLQAYYMLREKQRRQRIVSTPSGLLVPGSAYRGLAKAE